MDEKSPERNDSATNLDPDAGIAQAPQGETLAQASFAQKQDVLELLERLGKVAVLGIAVFYALGLVVTNAYLAQFGIAEWGLLRSRFVLTGLLVVAPLFVSFSFGQGFKNILLEHKNDYPGRWILSQANRQHFYVIPLLFGIVVIGLPGAIYYMILLTIGAGDSALRIAISLAGWSGLIAINIVLTQFLVAIRRGTFGTRPRATFEYSLSWWFLGSASRLGLGTLLFVAIFAGYLSVFVRDTYPYIPEQFGGGRPREVQLLLDPDQYVSVAQLHIPLQEGSIRLTETVALIWQGADGYLIRFEIDGEQHVILINRDLVDAVILDRGS